MRLINVHTLHFQEFFLGDKPPYAVVSHRWGEKEINYHEFLQGIADTQSQGYRKIVECAKIAQERGLDWIWLDTNCIDKTSSAELTEAINSMFQWYRDAVECYAILPDLSHGSEHDAMLESLRASVYFTRGWTLQELLAPKNVYFYDSAFVLFASKSELADTLFEITGIRKKYLDDANLLATACVAEKLSWMSDRVTTKSEDIAYCMIGLFGVNMPLLYGEGDKAFFRLQLEILKNSDDESIFAWYTKDKKTSGMLASKPSDFANSGNIRRFAIDPEHRVPWNWGSKGLEVRLLEFSPSGQAQKGQNDPVPVGQQSKTLTLGCWNDQSDPGSSNDKPSYKRMSNRIIAINLQRTGTAWQRTDCDRFVLLSSFETVTRLASMPLLLRHYYVPQDPPQMSGSYTRW